MKHIYFLFLIFSYYSYSQVPSNYYFSADGLIGYDLKTELKEIIDNVNDGLTTEFLSVDLGYSGLYVTYETSDIDLYYENNGTVLDMYSEKVDANGNDLQDDYEYTYAIESPDDRDSGFGGTAEGEFYNREHIIPQSVFGSATPMRSDAHFVVPSDKYVNGQRASYPFGVVDTSIMSYWESSNGSKRGNNLNAGYSAGYTGIVFEPIDAFKGDIARMIFYFVTRYEDDVANWSFDMFNGTPNQAFNTTFFNILYQWHIDDPVSNREIDRNNAIFNRQNNRNPFIDHPEYVQSIWSDLLSNKTVNDTHYKMYPNPVKGDIIYFSSKSDLNVEIYNVLGKQVLTATINTKKKFINISNLNKGVYLVKLTSNEGVVIKKMIKQ